jgi:hypothetical protein
MRYAMYTVREIETAITTLPTREFAKLREWFYERDAMLWDQQFEEDVQAGRLSRFAEKAIADYKVGKVTEL